MNTDKKNKSRRFFPIEIVIFLSLLFFQNCTKFDIGANRASAEAREAAERALAYDKGPR